MNKQKIDWLENIWTFVKHTNYDFFFLYTSYDIQEMILHNSKKKIVVENSESQRQGSIFTTNFI